MNAQPRYATLIQARHEIKQPDGAMVGEIDDAVVKDALRFTSARIDQIKGFGFAPRKIGATDEEAYYDSFGWHIDDSDNRLTLKTPMLSITSVEVGGTEWEAGVDYVTVPRAGTPIRGIRILPSSGKSWEHYVTDWRDSIVVSGFVGFRRGGFEAAHLSSGDEVEDAPLLANATTININDPEGADAFNRTPRFSAGQTIRLESGGNTEYCLVLDTVKETTPSAINRLIVLRGALGTTAVQHAQNTPISIWQPEDAVERACLRWTAYLYKRRGLYQTATYDGIESVSFPPDIPEEVRKALDELPSFYVGEGV